MKTKSTMLKSSSLKHVSFSDQVDSHYIPNVYIEDNDQYDNVTDTDTEDIYCKYLNKKYYDFNNKNNEYNSQIQKKNYNDNYNESTSHKNYNSQYSLHNTDDNPYPIESFHLKQEMENGEGRFVGDTYIFRRQEEDAWLQGLKSENYYKISNNAFTQNNNLVKKRKSLVKMVKPIENFAKEHFYQKIVNFMKSHETLGKTFKRYSKTLNCQYEKKRGKNVESEIKGNVTYRKLKIAIEELTEFSFRCMHYNGDIYQYTFEYFQSQLEKQEINKKEIQWLYRKKDTMQVYGPFSNKQMIKWIQAGYFRGDNVVDVRLVEHAEDNSNKNRRYKLGWRSSDEVKSQT